MFNIFVFMIVVVLLVALLFASQLQMHSAATPLLQAIRTLLGA
ncbi:hypothetical protein [Neobacillus mesonae]|nr:hypothetical protein [Neobacillus mesonae]